jgi:hypothetical protein
MQRGLPQVQQELKKATSGIDQQAMIQSVWRQTNEERKCVQLFRQSISYENYKREKKKKRKKDVDLVIDVNIPKLAAERGFE